MDDCDRDIYKRRNSFNSSRIGWPLLTEMMFWIERHIYIVYGSFCIGIEICWRYSIPPDCDISVLYLCYRRDNSCTAIAMQLQRPVHATDTIEELLNKLFT